MKSKKTQKKIKESKGRTKKTMKTKHSETERPMVIRVTRKEFELSDGRVFPMMFDYADDEVPTPEEFQKQYDQWLALFNKMDLTGHHEQATR